jgi:hypothetical protein
MSNNFKKRNVGYFDSTADMVAAKAGQNMVAICAGLHSPGDDQGGVFVFRRALLIADGLNIFAATGAGGTNGFWQRLPPILVN